MQILAVVLCLAATPARAEIRTALAMEGDPLYPAGFDHVDYANPDAPKGGTLRQAGIGMFDSINMHSLKGTAKAMGLALVNDSLMARRWNEPFTLYPLIAEKVDVPADRSSITFYLDPRATFQDGSPITADDVIYSFETLRDKGRMNMRQVYKLVSSDVKIDAHTVKLTFGPGYTRETVMILAMMPVLPKAWWQKRDFDSSSYDIPVGSGPYKIAAVDPGHSIVYDRVKDYWAADLPVNKGHYNFDHLRYDYYRDDGVALEAFKSGLLDLRIEKDAKKWANGYDIPAVRNGDIVKEELKPGHIDQLNALIFNTRRPIFADLRVRQALTLAFDGKWINDNLYYGLYQRIDSYFLNSYLAARGRPDAAEMKILAPFAKDLPASVFGDAPAPPPSGSEEAMRTNLRQADALLNQAGWVVRDGERVNAHTGAPFQFEILLYAAQDEKLALAYARDLKRLGIAASVRVLDTAAFAGRTKDYDYDMVLDYWRPTLSPGSEQTLYWTCAAAKTPRQFNYPGICNPAIDAIAGAMANVTSKDDLIAHAHALDRALRAGVYTIPLFYPGADFVAHRKTVHRPEITPLYGMTPETWWDDGQKR